VKGRPVGVFLTRLVVVLALSWVIALGVLTTTHSVKGWTTYRKDIIDRLQSGGEKHLVIVRYTPAHNVHREWVYNAADIDAAQIVWAREIPGLSLQPLLDHFKDRKVWVLWADSSPPLIEPYRPGGAF